VDGARVEESLGDKVLGLSDFAGRWSLEREILDRRADLTAHLSGTAVFTFNGADLRYEEEGRLEYPGQPPMMATRAYTWEDDGDGVWVFFDDGRPFHRFSLLRRMPEADHHCPPDMYHVTYDFTRWPDWSATWAVVGPRKNYRMISRYARLG
jgi:hypothetical protein